MLGLRKETAPKVGRSSRRHGLMPYGIGKMLPATALIIQVIREEASVEMVLDSIVLASYLPRYPSSIIKKASVCIFNNAVLSIDLCAWS